MLQLFPVGVLIHSFPSELQYVSHATCQEHRKFQKHFGNTELGGIAIQINQTFYQT